VQEIYVEAKRMFSDGWAIVGLWTLRLKPSPMLPQYNLLNFQLYSVLITNFNIYPPQQAIRGDRGKYGII